MCIEWISEGYFVNNLNQGNQIKIRAKQNKQVTMKLLPHYLLCKFHKHFQEMIYVCPNA